MSASTPKKASESPPEPFKDEKNAPLPELTSSTIVKNEWRNLNYLGVTQIMVDLSPGHGKMVVDDRGLEKQGALWSDSNVTWDVKATSPAQPKPIYPLPLRNDKVIGIVYLTSSLHVGELNIGIIIAEHSRGKGYARRAIELVTDKAFEDAKCHRLQAVLLNHVAKDRTLCLLTEKRFSHEGTRRHSFFSPMEHEWKGTTYMAILLDTDWMMSKSRGTLAVVRSAPKYIWDELFARHGREREELLRWESNTTLRRPSSTTTLCARSPIPTTPLAVVTSESASESEVSGDASSPRLSYLQKAKNKAGAEPTNPGVDDKSGSLGSYENAVSTSDTLSDSG